ncbi:MAG: hypothetical protein ACSLEM_04880 [Candidatus Malihini olakiniferum]
MAIAQRSTRVAACYHRGLIFCHGNLNSVNHAGALTLSILQSELSGGLVALTGKKMDMNATPKITLQPIIENVEVKPLTVVFSLPLTVSGKSS